MKQHKRLRLVSIVCLAALLVSCLPGAYAYGVSSAWAREELDAMAALDLIPALLEERGDLRENITRQDQELLLRAQDLEIELREEASLTSFIAGFRLGMGIAGELEPYCFEDEDERRATERAKMRCPHVKN